MSRPAAAAPASKRRTWAELEGYRVLAALAVVMFHIRQHMQVAEYDPAHQGLHVGDSYPYQNLHWLESLMGNVDVLVDFFFVLSGFLLALPFARSVIEGTKRPSTKAYALGRLLRAIPLYWAIVLVVWCTRNFGYPGEWRDLLEHLTFTQWLDSKRIFYTLGPSWSLADEIWFYATVPLVAGGVGVLVRRLRSRSTRALTYITVLLVVVAASVAWKLAVLDVWHVAHDRWSFYFGVPAKLDTFCLGGIAAVVVAWAGDRRLPRGTALALRVGSLAGLWWFVSHRLADLGAWNDFVHTGSAAFFAVVMVAIALGRPGLANRLCDNRYVLAGGGLTFALYIGHEALLDPLSSLGLLRMPFGDLWLNYAIGIPIACLAAWLLHVLLEEPATRLRGAFDKEWRVREYYPDLVSVEVPAQRPIPALERPGARLAG